MHSARLPKRPSALRSAHRPGLLLHLAVLYHANAFGRTARMLRIAPARAERSRQPPQASPFVRVGQGERLSCSQLANAPLHACTAVSILALLQWLWRRGKTGRAIAALAELSGLRERRACAWPICTGSLDAGSLWTTALTRAAAAAHISQGEAQLYRLVTRGCVFRSTDRFGRKLAASGVLDSHTQALVRKSTMSQSDVWPSGYGVIDALLRYKQEFTASVKLHTRLTRAIWDDLSANVPLQTGVSCCLQGCL